MEHTNKLENKQSLISVTAIVTALVFGVIALIVVVAGLHIPIPGTGVVTDPRELFTTIGAGLSGPIGGIIIGLFAGIAEPGGIPLASLLGHIMGGVWIGFAYKKLVYDRLVMPVLLLGWIGIVFIYYYVFLIPGFAVGIKLFYPEIYIQSFGDMNIMQATISLATGATWEMLITSFITTLVIIAMPKRNRKPLW